MGDVRRPVMAALAAALLCGAVEADDKEIRILSVALEPAAIKPGAQAGYVIEYEIVGMEAGEILEVEEIREIFFQDRRIFSATKVFFRDSPQIASVELLTIPEQASEGHYQLEASVKIIGKVWRAEGQFEVSAEGQGQPAPDEQPGSDAEQLRRQAEEAFDALRLISPEGDNVLFYADRLLELEPGNDFALGLKRRLGDHFLRQADAAFDSESWETASENYRAYLQVFPEDGRALERLQESKANLAAAGQGQVDAEQQLYQIALQEGTIAAFQRYLDSYPEGRFADGATQNILQLRRQEQARAEQLALQAAREADTIEAWQRFVSDYPQSAHAAEAGERIAQLQAERRAAEELQAFEEAQHLDTIEAFQSFLETYPESGRRAAAEGRIAELQAEAEARAEDDAFSAALRQNTYAAWQDYLDRFPYGKHIEIARERLQMLAGSEQRDRYGPTVRVAAGRFGSGEDGRLMVNVGEFWIDKYPVTNEQYKRFVDETGHRPPGHWSEGRIPAGLERHPVTHVSHADASAYAAWAGKSLPSAQEWEKACRGSDRRRYCWGNEEDERGRRSNIEPGEKGHTTPVDSFEGNAPSPFGAVDLHGNVWEWTRSQNPEGQAEYLVKGGSFRSSSEETQCWRWRSVAPDRRSDDIGFRCVWRDR